MDEGKVRKERLLMIKIKTECAKINILFRVKTSRKDDR